MFSVEWRPRAIPLVPAAVAAFDATAREVIRSLLRRQPDELLKLRGVSTGNAVLLLGCESELPWSDGVIYLGREPESEILVPTNLHPSLPVALLEEAITGRFKGLSLPFAVIPSPPLIVPLISAMQVTPDALTVWMEKQ